MKTELTTRTAVAAAGLVSQETASEEAAEMAAAAAVEDVQASPFFLESDA